MMELSYQRRRVSGIFFMRYVQNRKNGKPNNLFGSNETKGSKYDSQNRLRSPMSEGEEP